MRRCGLYFRLSGLLLLLYFTACVTIPEEIEEFRFSVINVGQGLSQIGAYQGTAVVWDMGGEEGGGEWLEVYKKAGMPYINVIVLSHGDLDHTSGLHAITPDINWSGMICLNYYEDTSVIKSRCSRWTKPIFFRRIMQDDTLLLGHNVQIRCLWPPEQVLKTGDEFEPNKYSLVFQITHNSSTALITSDIDSAACEEIFCRYGGKIKSDIFVVPHHGSLYSYNYSFFSSVQPNCAIISYGQNNYGHPSQQVISLLFSMNCRVEFTAEDGSFLFNSNGYYWTQTW
jgi:beta-lactamase superfamily II metal-dependent hydrolase